MRDIGYKSTSFALAELIDNSIQAERHAGSTSSSASTRAAPSPPRSPSSTTAGGMVAKMVRASLVWGAGTRPDNREGFGKYGYGLPSASVSQCLRVEVYSKTADGQWAMSYLDVDEISEGKWTKDHRINTPRVESGGAAGLRDRAPQGQGRAGRWSTAPSWCGTSSTDRIDCKTPRGAAQQPAHATSASSTATSCVDVPMTVDGVEVEPCDPLFLTPGFRYYDLDEDRAVSCRRRSSRSPTRRPRRSRAACAFGSPGCPPPSSASPRPSTPTSPAKADINERLPIADANNGIIFLRNGRQIDVVKPPKQFTHSVNATTDRFWAVEVDFDATLDDEFSHDDGQAADRPVGADLGPAERQGEDLRGHRHDAHGLQEGRRQDRRDRPRRPRRRRSRPSSTPPSSRPRRSPRTPPRATRRRRQPRGGGAAARRGGRRLAGAVEAELVAKEQESSRAVETRGPAGRAVLPVRCSVAGSGCCSSTRRTRSSPTSTPGRPRTPGCGRAWRSCSGHWARPRSTPSRSRTARRFYEARAGAGLVAVPQGRARLAAADRDDRRRPRGPRGRLTGSRCWLGRVRPARLLPSDCTTE